VGDNISYQTAEQGKFLQLGANTSFPPISVVRWSYPDTSSAFPENSAARPLSSIDVYPKYAVLTHLTNADDIKISLSAENINVSLDDLEDLTRIQNAIGFLQSYQLSAITTYIDDLEKNTFDTASACDDTYHELVKINNDGISVKYLQDSGNTDAFGRLRASMPTTLFDSKTLHNKSSLFWSQTASGNGAVIQFTSDRDDASVTLSAASVGGYAIRQTTQRFNYQPGKSQLAIFTGILNPVTNAIKRYGIFQSLTAYPFEPNCGLYFETLTDSSSSIAVVQQNDGFLVPSVSARRENWNIDKLDGSGPSGKTLVLSAANIFLIDYEWLGVGRVRFGTVIDGQICYCHAINNAGNVQGAYIKTPNLPVRAEIRQIGAGTASMKMICSSVMSEGGSDFTGVTRATDTGSTALTIGTSQRRAILGVRLQANKLDSVNEVLNASIMVLASNNQYAPYKYELLHNPYTSTTHGVTGGTWTNVDANSNFQYWRSDSTNPGGNEPFNGTIIASGYASVGAIVDFSSYRFEKFLRMGCSVNGVRDELYLVVTPLDGNNGIFGSLTFIESD
jgi:hypothetical protein